MIKLLNKKDKMGPQKTKTFVALAVCGSLLLNTLTAFANHPRNHSNVQCSWLKRSLSKLQTATCCIAQSTKNCVSAALPTVKRLGIKAAQCAAATTFVMTAYYSMTSTSQEGGTPSAQPGSTPTYPEGSVIMANTGNELVCAFISGAIGFLTHPTKHCEPL